MTRERVVLDTNVLISGLLSTTLTARGETPTAFGAPSAAAALGTPFGRRCIPADCVAPPSHIPDMLGRRALSSGRLAALGATPDFHHGLLTPARAVDHAISSGQLLASIATLRELMTKLLSPKFDRYVPRERRDALLLRLAPLIEIVEIVQSIRASRDPDDDKFLEAAVNGRADVVVSGDADLLELNPFRGIAILTPAAYLDRQT
jgi:putative PIN family toxin of toxin-antitoxin system